MDELISCLPPIINEEDDWVQHKIRSAKRAARSELSVSQGQWAKNGYAAQSSLLSTEGLVDGVERIHISDLTPQRFVEAYEQPRRPLVITGLTDAWPAASEWRPAALLAKYGQHKFKVGSDDDGYAVRLRLEHFFRYCAFPHHAGTDDSPLYIFDGTFAERSSSAGLAQHYSVPGLFAEDLFRLAGERRRPPYRWFVLGPARSGSGLHIDPLATSAWNALLAGTKRWALFPPGTPRELVLPKGVEREAASWFTHVFPRTQQPDWPGARPISLIQRPGETVFVPHGWWHAVLNLDLTIAVTHNYVSTANFAPVWRHSRKGRPKMSVRWLAALRAARPDLAAVADVLDAQGDAAGAGSASSSSSGSSSSSSSNSSSSSSSSDSSDDEGGGGSKPRAKRRKAADGAPAAAGGADAGAVAVAASEHGRQGCIGDAAPSPQQQGEQQQQAGGEGQQQPQQQQREREEQDERQQQLDEGQQQQGERQQQRDEQQQHKPHVHEQPRPPDAAPEQAALMLQQQEARVNGLHH